MRGSVSVRDELVHALELDLVGPDVASVHATETLDRPPSRWYLTGFLVPRTASEALRKDDDAPDDLDAGVEVATDGGDSGDHETRAAQKRFFPASMGLSVLVPGDTRFLHITVTWGDYARDPERSIWKRTPRKAIVSVVPSGGSSHPLPESFGLTLHVVDREVPSVDGRPLVAPGTRALSIFVVNERAPDEEHPERRDETYAFQVCMQIDCDTCFIARPDLHGAESADPDERVADLQFRDVHEYAVGHGVAPVAAPHRSECTSVATTWVPSAWVHRVEAAGPADLGVDPGALALDALAESADPRAVQDRLAPMVDAWRAFIRRGAATQGLTPARAEVARALCEDARLACERLADGVARLADPEVFRCFRVMNAVIAAAMRQRDLSYAAPGAGGKLPAWRPFQLAFILINLAGVVDPTHPDRRRVDLLYFPTGGGKTEAYLGLAAFSLLLRRRRHEGRAGGGVGVLMRYTLRLLTLDQLERATALVCAMELERRRAPEVWGAWPFEIGLWVGSAATPNLLGDPAAPSPGSAADRVRQWKRGAGERPVPIERCPWCQHPLERARGAEPFELVAGNTPAARLQVQCTRRGDAERGGRCPFSLEGAARREGPGALPMCLTDEEIYRRVPAFVIATVDKFANLPWVGPSGALLGRVTHADANGYSGPADPRRVGERVKVPPPDLVIQDELHLISGPLGTMVGLYEAAFDALMARDGVRPKVVASTATVRRAEAQTRALFCREGTTVFPPPMPDRRDLFFARTVEDRATARRYVGVAAQGRAQKVALLRVYLALVTAAQKHWRAAGGPVEGNPADPYMTLLGYFNSLKELGNARRIVEDEVVSRARVYGARRRQGEDEGLFADRALRYEVDELTSRERMAKVSQTKAALTLTHAHRPKDGDLAAVDIALATNMISVGLDIKRLGLMVVNGQPKATAEYIQTTSRVGRDASRPGLVVTLLNIHRPRDRSHYERFEVFHEAFYRAVEATSVTPFSPRALDRGVAAVTVALARHGWEHLTPAKAVTRVNDLRPKLDEVAATLAAREEAHTAAAVSPRAGARAKDVLDTWVKLVDAYAKHSELQYGREPEARGAKSLLHTPLEDVEEGFEPFRARRSLRDVEPEVNVWMRSLGWEDDEVEDAP